MEFLTFLSQQWLLVGTLLVLGGMFLWRERIKSGKPVTTSEAIGFINADKAIWLDVRESAEYKAGHIVDALNIPHAKVLEQLSLLEKHRDKVIIIVDKAGQHAGSVGRQLIGQNFVARRLSGGMTEWQSQALPLVRKK